MTDNLSRHPIASAAENERKNYNMGQHEAEAELEIVINQIQAQLKFIQMNGSMKKFTDRNKLRQKVTNLSTARINLNKTKKSIRLKPWRHRTVLIQSHQTNFQS